MVTFSYIASCQLLDAV